MRTSALLAALLALAVAGCGEDREPEVVAATTTTVTAPPTATATTTSAAPDQPAGPDASSPIDPGDSQGPAESSTEDPRVNALERAAARTVRRYVAALDARDGAAVCELLAPGALQAVELPKPGAGCAASLDASIGYRDPRGLPVWAGAEVAELRSVEIDDGEAKVVATIVTRFADRDEASVEDDVVYLLRDRGRWLVAKPSATLYRAVGIADVPPTVLSPPD